MPRTPQLRQHATGQHRKVRERGPLRRRARTATYATLAGSLIAAASAVPSGATATGPGIAPGHNITVFHNIDFVAVFGYELGQDITVDVFRGPVKIGTATGPAVETPEGPGLEVNHGPAGAPAPGDCWDGHTPDIRPSDRIVVTQGTTIDETTVDDIGFSGPPEVVPAAVAPDPGPATEEIHVKGWARTYNGTAIPVAELDSAEFRDTSKFRGGPNRIDPDPTVVGGFILVYVGPNYEPADMRNDLGYNAAQRRQSLLGDGHAAGFGHTAPLPDESMLVDGITDAPGPAPGCEGSPGAVDEVTDVSIDGLSQSFINIASVNAGDPVDISGVAFAATKVDVTIDDTDAGTAAITTSDTPTSSTGAGTWSTTVSMSDLESLSDGLLTVAATFTKGGTPLAGRSKTMIKDTVAPNAPTASPPGGPYVGAQSVSVSPGAGTALVRYSLGAASLQPTSLVSGQLSITSSQTLKLRSFDAAGNSTDAVPQVYTITAPPAPVVVPPPAPVVVAPPAPVVVPPAAKPPVAKPAPKTTVAKAPQILTATSGKAGGKVTAKVRWLAPLSNGGSAITGYKVSIRRVGSTAVVTRTVSAKARSLIFKGLVKDARYRFYVQAVNARGTSLRSALSNKVAAK